MSLGALAAAASLAAAATPNPSATYRFPHEPYPSPPPPPAPSPPPKHVPTPVAPAPSSDMHPSHQQNTHANGKPKQRRYRASPEQLRQLIARFDVNPSPSSSDLQELALQISMPAQSVVLWFKNRRARVPHKKAEKAMAAKRREASDPPTPTPKSVKSPPHQSIDLVAKPNPSTVSIPTPSLSFSAEAAAAMCMAEMAMTSTLPKANTLLGNDVGTVARGRTRSESSPIRTPSCSPPPHASNLVHKLGSNATANGAEFVASSNPTPRRPRVLPPTPRLFSQREYKSGDRVEVLEATKGICRSWYSASIVCRSGPKELSLGQSAAAAGLVQVSSTRSNVEGWENMSENGDGNDSPRTVRSPVTSPTPAIAKMSYLVRYEHRLGEHVEEEVVGSRLRPEAPRNVGEWRPEVGEAVEVLREGAWCVAVTQKFVVRKGYMVSYESGDAHWVRRHNLRPYQIWRGGERWVTKTKAPLPVVRKSVGLTVTHPPGGKRKRRVEGLEGVMGRSKRSKSSSVDCSGPDGLPEGWRLDHMRWSGIMGGGRGKAFYIAPDGNRLRSLKEAQRYVKMMGPA